MPEVSPLHLDKAIQAVLENLVGITSLYPNQHELLAALFENENIFYTDSTNSGKTLPAVIFPEILKNLNGQGYYMFPSKPKLLFVTALNSLKLSLVNNTKAIGIDCAAVTTENVRNLLESDTSVLFISPEVLKVPAVTQTLLNQRSAFVLKVVDECHLGNIS